MNLFDAMHKSHKPVLSRADPSRLVCTVCGVHSRTARGRVRCLPPPPAPSCTADVQLKDAAASAHNLLRRLLGFR